MFSDIVSPPSPGSKDSWGPRLWKVLHNIAWLSDRTDVIYIWKNVMKSLSDVMPCPICRAHLAEYMNSRIMFATKNAHLVKSAEHKERIVYSIWLLHNIVNEQTGKGEYPMDLLTTKYLDRTRSDIIHETNQLLREIYIEWEPLVAKQVTLGAFRELRSNMTLLIGLISGGPN